MVRIALLGDTGGCDSAFLKYALEAGKGEPAGNCSATAETGMRMDLLYKNNVGIFNCDEIGKNEWGGKPVQLYKAK